MGYYVFAHIIQLLECPGEVRPFLSEFLFFFIKKEPVALTNVVPFKLVVPSETLKACVLIGPLFLPAEGEARSSGSQSPDLGDMWRHGCPKSPESVSLCSTSETFLGCEVYEHNNERRGIEVIGQDWSSEVVALFLEDWELRRVASSCHMTLDFLSQEMRDACWDTSEWFSLFTVFAMLGKSPSQGREPAKSTVTASESLSLSGNGL